MNDATIQDTDDERAFRLKAREWMAGRLPPRIPGQPYMDWDDKELIATDRRTQRVLWEGGLAGITVPTEYGGLGLDRRYEAIFGEEAAPYRLAWHLGNNYNIVIRSCSPMAAKHRNSTGSLPCCLESTYGRN